LHINYHWLKAKSTMIQKIDKIVLVVNVKTCNVAGIPFKQTMRRIE